jgi:guanine deaminase
MNRFMKRAYDEAIKGMDAGAGGPFGAVVVRAGEVIATAHNSVLATNDPTMHAEIAAIRAASAKLGRFDLSDCELYATCQPCPMCQGAIQWARLKKVYYGASAEDAAKGGFDDAAFHANPPAMEVVDSDEMRELFSLWLGKSDRKTY